MKRFNYRVNAELTGFTIQNEENTVSFLRSVGISVQTTDESCDYFWFYTDRNDDIIFQWTKGVTSVDVEAGYTLNLDYEKQLINLIGFDEFFTIIKDNICYAPYGFQFKLSDILNWKPIILSDIGMDYLYDDYFSWRIEESPSDKDRLLRLKELF